MLLIALVCANLDAGLAESARAWLRGGVAPLVAVAGAILMVQAYRKQSFTRIDVEQGGSVLVTVDVVRGGEPVVSRTALDPGRMLTTRVEGIHEWVVLVQKDESLPVIKLPHERQARARFLAAVERLLLPRAPRGEPGGGP
jgi:hypothetical protein